MVNAAHFLGVSLDVLVDDSLMRQMKELRGNSKTKKPDGRGNYPARGCSVESGAPVGLEPTLYRF